MNKATTNTDDICNTFGPWAPSGLLDPCNLYQLPPFHQYCTQLKAAFDSKY
jgi:hypothetical protein